MGFPSPPHRKRDNFFSLRSESRLLSFSHSLSIFSLFKKVKPTIFFRSIYKKKKKKTNGEKFVWVNFIFLWWTIFFFESKTSRPSVRPVRPSTFVQFGLCIVHTGMYIHSLARPIGFQQTPSPHFTYLLTYICPDLDRSTKGGDNETNPRRCNRPRKKRKKRETFLRGEGVSRAAVPYYLIIQNLIQNLL